MGSTRLLHSYYSQVSFTSANRWAPCLPIATQILRDHARFGSLSGHAVLGALRLHDDYLEGGSLDNVPNTAWLYQLLTESYRINVAAACLMDRVGILVSVLFSPVLSSP